MKNYIKIENCLVREYKYRWVCSAQQLKFNDSRNQPIEHVFNQFQILIDFSDGVKHPVCKIDVKTIC
jgi:hypothetical protein